MNICTVGTERGNRARGAKDSFGRSLAALALVAGLLVVTCFAPNATQSLAGEPQPFPVVAPSVSDGVAPASLGPPLAFVENAGQFDGRIDFVVRSGNVTLSLTNEALWISLSEPTSQQDAVAGANGQGPVDAEGISCRRADLKISFVDADPHPRLEPFGRLDTRASFFYGNDPANWHTGVRAWSGVRYVDLYPGVTLEISGQNGQLAQRLVVRERSFLRNVSLQVEGADAVTLDGGYLRLATALGEVSLPLLVAEGMEPRVEPAVSVVDGAYYVSSPFAPPSLPATLAHPANASPLQYSTYLGGSCEDRGYDIAVDSAGNVYITGQVASVDFPATPGTYDPSNNDDPPGCQISDYTGDVFITKLSADGSTLLFSTYLGGNSEDAGYGIALDGMGNIYLAGKTYSVDFPTTPGALDGNLSGGRDAFVAKLNAAGDDLVYSTYLGGDSWEYGLDIVADGQGYAYATGFTHGGFPTTPGVVQPASGGSIDPFVVKLNPDGNDLVYSTYLGGSSSDGGESIAVDGDGNAYVTGGTGSTDFPTVNPLQPANAGGTSDAFVAKLNADGSGLIYSTYLGGSTGDGESGYGVVVDSAGNAYVTGATAATNFPIVSPIQPAYGGGELDAFLAKLNADGSALVYSTYLGGSGVDRSLGIGIDAEHKAYITGYTSSSDLMMVDPLQAAKAGGYDAFLAKVNYHGNVLLYSTYLGGSADDNTYGPRQGDAGLAVALTGKVYLTGLTASTDFPTSSGALDVSFNGGDSDVFVTCLDLGPVREWKAYLPQVLGLPR